MMGEDFEDTRDIVSVNIGVGRRCPCTHNQNQDGQKRSANIQGVCAKVPTNYLIFFDRKGKSLLIYKDDWKERLLIDEIDGEDMMELIRIITNSDPPSQTSVLEEEWDWERIIKSAEKMISRKGKK